MTPHFLDMLREYHENSQREELAKLMREATAHADQFMADFIRHHARNPQPHIGPNDQDQTQVIALADRRAAKRFYG